MRNSNWLKYLALPVVLGLAIAAVPSILRAEERIVTDKINVFAVMSENIEASVKVATVDLKATENAETYAP